MAQSDDSNFELRPKGNVELEEEIRRAFREDGRNIHIEEMQTVGNTTILYRCGKKGVAKVMLPSMPLRFLANHQRELDFYRRTKRYPFRDVRGDVLLMDLLEDGEVPNQIEGLSFEQLARILKSTVRLHKEETPWTGMERVEDVGLSLAYDMALPLLSRVSVERMKSLGFCVGREEEAVLLMHQVMGEWESLLDDLQGNCMVHGDLRGENVFLPYDKQKEAVLIDWQLTCAGSRFVDLAYLLSTSLTVEDLKVHEEDLLRVYAGDDFGDEFLEKYRRALQWPVAWAVFVCGGGMDYADKRSEVWTYQSVMTERFLQANLRQKKYKKEKSENRRS
mmetsp:Transcript_22216/g.62426  ORF Transcript_22216/g.62426 Transcript_22216/m.62426 type:complete len:334 (+) Transcript_22216:37-1038(+)